MNRFLRHHRDSIRFTYSCFDRIILNGIVQPWQDGFSVHDFFEQRGEVVTKNFFTTMSLRYHDWVSQYAAAQQIQVRHPEREEQIERAKQPRQRYPQRDNSEVRREDLVRPYFHARGGRPGVAVILRAREPERIAVCYPKRGHHIELDRRWIDVYYFYLQHEQAGRAWLRVCPYFPFNIRFWMNGHDWLASRLRAEGIPFKQNDNSFTACADPRRLQELADSFSAEDLQAILTPLVREFAPALQPAAAVQHRFFMAQMEYCHNTIFHSPTTVQRLFDRLAEQSRSLGQPDKVGIVFRRRGFGPRHTFADARRTMLGTSVIRAGFNNTSIKQYIRPGALLRTEAASFQLRDLAIPKAINNLPRLRRLLAGSNDRYLCAQQDILETYLDRGEMQRLRQASVSPTGRRTPGMRLDDRRLLALLQAITAFTHLVGAGCFRTTDLLERTRAALNQPDYNLNQLRYDLAKLRAKNLVERVPSTHTYRLTDQGYRIAVLYLKLYHRLYAPLTTAILDPYPPDNQIQSHRRLKLDRLYAAIDETLQQLIKYLGLAQPA